MSATIDVLKLTDIITESYTVDELEKFLSDYFSVRLANIVEPRGLSRPKIVSDVIGYFDRRGNLVDLVRELQRDRPGKIDLLDLLIKPSASQPRPSPAESSTIVDIDTNEADFYFIREPDRRTVPTTKTPKPAKEAIYVRLSVKSSSQSTPRSTSPRALALALDRSGSMAAERKIDTARIAANSLLDIAHKNIAQGSNCQVVVIAFDHRIEIPIPLQRIENPEPHKSTLRQINPDGGTDLFAAWEKAVATLRTLNETWDRHVVLITDGIMEHGMTDPVKFEKTVATAWKTEKIKTSCISMSGNEWNADLLYRLASAGSGRLHPVITENEAEQSLYDAFHIQSSVVAYNLQVELEPLGSTHVTQVNGRATSLKAGQVKTFLLTNQLRTNIGEQLKGRGLLPWLDEWELRPGLPWQRLLEGQIENIKTAAVFIGANGIGPWQQMEIDTFLREFVRRNCPVIPVILPNTSKEPRLPQFLAGMTWVDFRKQNPDPMERLIWGITGRKR